MSPAAFTSPTPDMDVGYAEDDPADLWENITPVTPAQFVAICQDAAQPTHQDDADGAS